MRMITNPTVHQQYASPWLLNIIWYHYWCIKYLKRDETITRLVTKWEEPYKMPSIKTEIAMTFYMDDKLIKRSFK